MKTILSWFYSLFKEKEIEPIVAPIEKESLTKHFKLTVLKANVRHSDGLIYTSKAIHEAVHVFNKSRNTRFGLKLVEMPKPRSGCFLINDNSSMDHEANFSYLLFNLTIEDDSIIAYIYVNPEFHSGKELLKFLETNDINDLEVIIEGPKQTDNTSAELVTEWFDIKTIHLKMKNKQGN